MEDENIHFGLLFQEMLKRRQPKTQTDKDTYKNIDSNLLTFLEVIPIEIRDKVLKARNGMA